MFYTAAAGPEGYPRGNLPEVALAGRSNVGKSSLLNKLINRKGLARVSRRPGRTQTINFFLINKAFYLVDLPGYGFARVPEEVKMSWGPMVEGYLSKRETLRGVLLLIDIRREPAEMDLQLYEWLLYYNIPVAVAATKSDKLSRGKRLAQARLIKKRLVELEKELLGVDTPAQNNLPKVTERQSVPGGALRQVVPRLHSTGETQNHGEACKSGEVRSPGEVRNPGEACDPGEVRSPGDGPLVIPFSAKTGEGREKLLAIIESWIK